ncbi:hypothetical protein WJX73_010319 [Symbiochloris irregularis]|uniref:IBR domain-containing protein n=1 Tax=Symbiochloris irregularis TaxID=706552 RepID=A0AAW1NEU2_9CHLO
MIIKTSDTDPSGVTWSCLVAIADADRRSPAKVNEGGLPAQKVETTAKLTAIWTSTSLGRGPPATLWLTLSVSQCEIVVPELRDQIEQLYAEAAIPTENKFHCPTCGQQQALQDASVEELGAREGWRRCHNCRSMIERTYGCNHITCLCGTEFCYRCGGPWTAAGCRRGCGLYTEAQMRRHYRPDLEARQQGDEDHDQEFSQCVAIVGAALVALAVFSVGRRVTR